MSVQSVFREATRLLDRHDRRTAVRVADDYARQAYYYGSADRCRFWSEVSAALRSHMTEVAIRGWASEEVDMRPRVVAVRRRQALVARLVDARSPPPDVVAALRRARVEDLETIVTWLTGDDHET